MVVYYRTQGIILGKQDVLEADRVFTIFTKDFGKLKLWAVSERKIISKLRGGLELFYLSEIEFIQGRARKTITDAVPLCRYPILRGDLERLRIMYRFAEITDELTGGQEQDEKIWILLQEVLVVLNRPLLRARDVETLAYYFLWNLLSLLGYSPSLDEIADQDARIAEFIGTLLRSNGGTLQNIKTQGINEALLRTISQEHLLKILQN